MPILVPLPTIEMSAGFAAGLPARVIMLGDQSSSGQNDARAVALAGLLTSSYWGFGTGGSVGYLYLMQGAVPVSFPATLSDRAADILVGFASYTSAVPSGGNFITTNQSVNPAVISTEYKAASASGTCTWFWWVVNTASSGGVPNTSLPPTQQIIGTVGATGSGSDLEIPSVTITAGEQYRVLNLRLQFPTSWTY